MARHLTLAFVLSLTALAGCSGDRIDALGCQSNRDCAADELCISGSCEKRSTSVRCARNEDCDLGEFCDIVDESCKPMANPNDGGTSDDGSVPNDGGVPAGDGGPPPSCQTDAECGAQPQDICVASQCVTGCNETDGLVCTGGQECDAATGHCRAPMSSCNQDGDCMPGPPTQICEAQQCVFGCAIDGTLCDTSTEVCDTATGRCVALNARCMIDSECVPGPPGQVCEGGQCVPGCAQPGGVQCGGQTPNCGTTTGRCEGAPTCMLDSECNDPNLICVNQGCSPRCDAPGAPACPATEVCNADDGRCVPGNIALGATCSLDAQCQSEFCLTLNRMMTPTSFCTQPCGASADCPNDFGCISVNGMGFCIPETFFMPAATFDTPAGGMCSETVNTCRSGVCNTGNNQCIGTCSRNQDCATLGGNCWMWSRAGMTGNDYTPLCIAQMGAANGLACTANGDCQSGICNRNTRLCAAPCCADQDCGGAENCTLYDLDAQTGDIVKVCRARVAGAGTRAIGTTCAMASECESGICAPLVPTSSTSARRCSTTCCTENDCSILPSGGRCRPFNGPMLGTTQTIVGLCVPN